MHILHLLDPASCGDEGILACHHAATTRDEFTHHEIWVLGSAADERRVWALGIPSTDRIRPRALGGTRPGLSRLIADRESRPDIVQCWSLPALALARQCFGTHDGAPARVGMICRPPLRSAGTPRLQLDPTGREIVCTLDTRTRAAITSSLGTADDSRRWGPSIRIIEPPTSPPGGPLSLDRSAMRAALGLEPFDVVIAHLSDPPESLDAMAAMFTAGVLHAVGHRTVSLIRRGARQERRAAAYLHAHARRWGMILTDLSLPQMLAAADLALIDHTRSSIESPTPTCGPISVSLALSMGIPIAAAPGLFLSDPSSPGERWPVHIGHSDAPGRTAVPLADLLDSAALRIDLAAATRSWCDRARTRDAFRRVLSNIWAEAAPNAAIPEPVEAGG